MWLDRWVTKKNVFIASLTYPLIWVPIGILTEKLQRALDMSSTQMGNVFFAVFLIPTFISLTVLFFSLLTYKLHDSIFRSWRSFAAWWVPLMLIVGYFIFTSGSSGGLGIESAIGGAFDLLVLSIFYTLFIAISLALIIGKFYAIRSGKSGLYLTLITSFVALGIFITILFLLSIIGHIL